MNARTTSVGCNLRCWRVFGSLRFLERAVPRPRVVWTFAASRGVAVRGSSFDRAEREETEQEFDGIVIWRNG